MTTQSVKSSGDNGSAAQAMTGDVFWPSQDVVRQANVPDWEAVARRAAKDLPGFWEEQARELEWYGAWTSVLDESQNSRTLRQPLPNYNLENYPVVLFV